MKHLVSRVCIIIAFSAYAFGLRPFEFFWKTFVIAFTVIVALDVISERLTKWIEENKKTEQQARLDEIKATMFGGRL